MLSKRLKSLLVQKKVATISELSETMGCAQITARKALADLDYVTSYNHNSRFYALRSVCRFDRNGIWRHKMASFARQDTLTALLVDIVDDSSSGLSSTELEAITGVSLAGVLQRLTKKGKLVRVRCEREYVYFSARAKRRRTSQARKRFGSSSPLAHQEEDLSVEELKKTLVIFLEIIRTQPSSVRQLRDRLRRTHPEISSGIVSDVCRQYDIGLKKKIDRYQIFDSAVKLAETIRKKTGGTYVFHFAADRPYCPTCGEPTEYYKTTKERTIKTLRYGDVPFRESQVVCRKHRYDPEDASPLIYGSSFARSLAPTKSPFGFDVITEIGKKRFLEYRQVEEVMAELKERGIGLCSSTVSRWADYFLASVECLHYTKIQKLRYLIKQNGGYLLHIDATTETKADTVFVCVDRLLGTVLLSEKISSENKEEVKEQLRRLKRYLGKPLAIMRDMSSQIEDAVREVFPGVPDRICQAHFLRDIGKDLLQEDHVQLGRQMVTLKINADLQRMKRELERRLSADEVWEASTWFRGVSGIEELSTSVVRKHEDVLALRLIMDVLAYRQDGEGLGFPFDLKWVHFCSRLNRLRLRLERYRQRHPRLVSRCPHLEQLGKIAARTSDATLRRTVKILRSVRRHFQTLRSVLRFEVKKKTPLAATMSIGTLKEIRAYNRGLVAYTKHLLAVERRDDITASEEVILKHLRDYQFNLPIPEHLVELLQKLDRTNNFEEGLFRGCKKGQRRQTGKKDISREFSFHGPHLPLMLNLRNDHYVAAMIGDIRDLPIRLSELDPRDIAYYIQKLKENRRGKFFEQLNGIDGIDLLPAHV